MKIQKTFSLLGSNLKYLVFIGMMGSSLSTAVANDGHCETYHKETSRFPLSRLNPVSSDVSGVSLPGNKKVLYRGVYQSHPSYDLTLALKAMVGEKVTFGSPFHFNLTQVLTGKKDIDAVLIPGTELDYPVRRYLEERKILPDMLELLACAKGVPYSETVAAEYADDLVDKMFSRFGDSEIASTFFDLRDPKYYATETQKIGFGNNAIDFMISSTYDQIAGIYGNKILVFEESEERTLDLCYWNLIHNGMYCDIWMDRGEMNTAGSISSKNILGYQDRKKDRPRGGRELFENPIDYAYYRVNEGGKSHVLVLDAKDALCITEGKDGKYYTCGIDKSALLNGVAPLPESLITSTQVSAIGVITSDVAAAERILKRYGSTSERGPSEGLTRSLKSLNDSGIAVRFIGTGLAHP